MLGMDPVRARDLPYRDEARFFLTPSKRGDISARRYGEEVHRVAAPGATIVADFTPMAVLRYLRDVEGRRPDLVLASSSDLYGTPVAVASLVARQGPRGAVYVAGTGTRYYDLTGIAPSLLEPRGPLFELVEQPKPPAPPEVADGR
jgi:hypothetical protein